MEKAEISLDNMVSQMQKRYEDKGFTLYSRSTREKLSILIMFYEEKERFSIIVFENECPWNYESVDCFVDVAKLKAELFGSSSSQLKSN